MEHPGMLQLLRANPWITVAFASWILAQALKVILHAVRTKRMDFSRLVDSGGMPSSHSAFTLGLSTEIGLSEGFRSPEFAIALCFAMVVVYDATNLRRSAGYHAQLLNEIVPQLLQGKLLSDKTTYRKLRELLGHSPMEVFVGALLGILVAALLHGPLVVAAVPEGAAALLP
ncbi:divergent PAP2 family protein [bacterium]|nr:divergent PAP2 family protein [bacterium]